MQLLKSFAPILTLLAALLFSGAPAQASSWRELLPEQLFETMQPWVHRYRAWRADVQIEPHIRIPVDADTALSPLQATLYLPRRHSAARLPTIVVMLPYNRHRYGEALRAGIEFGRAGFAVLTVDLRGYESDPVANDADANGANLARPIPWQGVQRDGSAMLDWIIAQPWSNGSVGSFGCSALGETQFALARAQHPAHQAMLVAGAGGALGKLNGQYGYFGIFEGGILQLASGYGWLAKHGWLTPPFERQPYADPDNPLPSLMRLPVTELVPGTDNAWQFITATPLDDPRWRTLGYVMDDTPLTIPLLTINTWGDQTLDESIRLHRFAQHPARQLVLAPGGHCQHESGPAPDGSAQGWQALYNDWFRRWLLPAADSSTDGDTAAHNNPATDNAAAVSYRLPGQTQWQTAAQWPPPAQHEYWHLYTVRGANSVRGDGRLVRSNAPQRPADTEGLSSNAWRADPAQPVPSVGGPMCCTSSPPLVAGAQNQAAVEARDDVLVFTSEPFAEDADYAGDVTADLFVSSEAADFDVVVRVTDVAPDGTSVNVQEGAQRVSMTPAGAARKPGDVIALTVAARQIAHRFARGHRLRLHVAASSFPRLARNLQSGGPNRHNTRPVSAEHRLHFSHAYPSRLSLYRLTPAPVGAGQ